MSPGGKSNDKREALMVGGLFLVVIGLSVGLTTLDVELPEEENSLPDVEEFEANNDNDQDVVHFAEALSNAGQIPPEELAAMGMEDLLDQGPTSLTLEGEVIPKVDDELPVMKDKLYNDLLVYDQNNPVLGKNGEPVAIPTPPTSLPRAGEDRADKYMEPALATAEEPGEPVAEESQESSPMDTGARMTSASQKLKKGDPRGAAEEYKKVLAEKPGYTKARVDLAQAYYEMNDTSAATKALDKALKAQPTHAKALLLRASIAQGEGRSSEARKFYQRFVDNHPTSPKVRAVQSILGRL